MEVILPLVAEADTEVTLVSLNPEIADVSAASIVIPAGKLVGTFKVVAKAAGETSVEVSLASGLKVVLPVEVLEKSGGKGGDEGEEGEEGEEEEDGAPKLVWAPSAIKVMADSDRGVGLVFEPVATSDTTVTLTQVEGPDGLVQFPASVTIPAGSEKALVVLTAGSQVGTAKIQAALPDELGGATAVLTVQVRAKK